METSSMATGIVKAETRGRSSWKEDVFVRMERAPFLQRREFKVTQIGPGRWHSEKGIKTWDPRLRLVDGVKPRVPGS